MSSVLRFKIELLEVTPIIWRRIEVPAEYSFWDLHVAIQDSMGWTDSHLHAFELSGSNGTRMEGGIPDPDGMTEVALSMEGNLGDMAALASEARKTGDFSEVSPDLNPEIHRMLMVEGREYYAALLHEIADPVNRPPGPTRWN